MPEQIYLEVDENDNCDYMPLQLYEATAEPVPICKVRLFEPGRPHGVYDVTGWQSDDGGSPTPAMYAPVSDSGQAEVHLIYGGDWGVRFRPVDTGGDWALDDPDQWGEPYVMLIDRDDILLDSR